MSSILLNALVAKVRAAPECSMDIYSLSPGPAFDGQLPPATPGCLDVARLSSILHNNGFHSAMGAPGDSLVNRDRWSTHSGELRVLW